MKSHYELAIQLMLVAGLALLVAMLGCSNTSAKIEASDTAVQHDHGGEEHDSEAAEEKSDLDQSVDELFAATCEHKMKTFECTECRYEVGVVKAPVDLCNSGLLKTAKVERRTAATPLVLNGEVGFDEELVRHLTIQSNVLVRKVIVVPGEFVRVGAPLLELESIEIGELQGDYLEAQAMLKLAQSSFERSEKLFKEGIASEREHLQTKHEWESSRIKAEALSNKLNRLGMDSSDIVNLSGATATGRFFLRAPIAGKVLSIHAIPGESTQREQPLLTLGETSQMWVWVDLYERDLPVVNKAALTGKMIATVKVKEFPDETFSGVVHWINATVNPSTRTVKIRVSVSNPKSILMAGMFAEATIFLQGDDQALTIEQAAVMEDEGRSFVFIHHHDDYYLRRPVTIGRSWSQWSEVLTGLTGDEFVVTDGAFLLKSDVLRSKMGAGCAD